MYKKSERRRKWEETTIQGDGYTVTIPDESDADTPVIATVYEDELEQFENDILMSATHGLDSGLGGSLFARSDTPVEGLYSARYPSEDMTAQTLTPEEIDELADGLQKVAHKNASAQQYRPQIHHHERHYRQDL